MPLILAVDDEPNIMELLKFNLSKKDTGLSALPTVSML
jgi:CheY-like chemotaxis protein